MMGRCVE